LSSKSSKNNDQPDTARLIALGRLVATHGVRGELRLLPYAFPCPTLQKGLTVCVQDKTGASRLYCVTSVRPQAPCLLVKLQGIDTLAQAQALRESTVSVTETQLAPLRDGEFYYCQVIGLKVRTRTGKELGTIAEVFFSGGHDVWVVRQGEEEYLIPVTEEIVRSLDIPGGQAIIEPIAGLLEANRQ
jgi:16S rRNA processing protein RimM